MFKESGYFFIVQGLFKTLRKHIESTAVLRHVSFFWGGGGASRLRSRVILATFGVHFGDFRII